MKNGIPRLTLKRRGSWCGGKWAFRRFPSAGGLMFARSVPFSNDGGRFDVKDYERLERRKPEFHSSNFVMFGAVYSSVLRSEDA